MEYKKRQQIIIKIVCLIASFALWLYIYNTNNFIISYTIRNVKVQLQNVDVLSQYKLALLPPNDYTVDLTVKGLASDVRTIKAGNFKVVADMAGYSLRKGENTIPFVVMTKPDSVSVEIVGDMRVTVNLDDLMEKTVPVKIELNGNPKAGFQELNAIAKPTSVMVSGPAQYVTQVTQVDAKCNIADLDKDINLTIPLVPTDNWDNIVQNVSVAGNSAEVSIPIKNVKTVNIVIKTKGSLMNGAIFKAATPIPNKVDIAGSEADLQGISSIDTQVIDLSKISAQSYQNGNLETNLVVPKNIKLVNSDGTISYMISSSNIIQKTLKLNIQYKNSALFSVNPSEAQLVLVVSGEQSVINKLTDTDIVPYVDLSAAKEGEMEVPVLLGNLPVGVSIISQVPTILKVNTALKPKT